MFQLIFVSFLWAFSFGLIKSQLTGLDSNLVAAIRLLISFLTFLPFIKIDFLKKIGRNKSLFLCLIGAVQFGLMYVCYIKAYQYLKSYEVALFTIFTPFYISLFSDLIAKSFTPRNFIAAFLAILGGLIVAYTGKDISVKWQGILLLQGANIAFATGQLLYSRIDFISKEQRETSFFALLYLGGFLTATSFALMSADFGRVNISTEQLYALLYLGALPSGLGFFLWNYGARRVSTAMLSAINNLTIPVGVIVSIFFYNEAASRETIIRLIFSCLLIFSGMYIGSKKASS